MLVIIPSYFVRKVVSSQVEVNIFKKLLINDHCLVAEAFYIPALGELWVNKGILGLWLQLLLNTWQFATFPLIINYRCLTSKLPKSELSFILLFVVMCFHHHCPTWSSSNSYELEKAGIIPILIWETWSWQFIYKW